jgi:hypothetical protein
MRELFLANRYFIIIPLNAHARAGPAHFARKIRLREAAPPCHIVSRRNRIAAAFSRTLKAQRLMGQADENSLNKSRDIALGPKRFYDLDSGMFV